jgi:transcriptional regulator GlxA family with amidase domain
MLNYLDVCLKKFPMIKVAILLVDHGLIAAIGNVHYVFKMVNSFLEESDKQPLFDIKLVAANKQVSLNDGLYKIQTDEVLDESFHPDLVIIPPMSGSIDSWITKNRKYIPWLVDKYKNGGTEIASLCVGAFVLAETGLLDGLECSTHWNTANEFRLRYPDIKLVDYKIITDYNGLYTSGGANSYWNLLIYLIDKYVDHDIAIRTSKYFEVEMERVNQSIFTIFEGIKNHKDTRILDAQNYIENRYSEKLSIDELADKCALSSRTFQRRFKKATHLTVSEYIQKIKMEVAKKLLESGRMTINEVMAEVGYNDPKAFRQLFKKACGTTPLKYKNRYVWM